MAQIVFEQKFTCKHEQELAKLLQRLTDTFTGTDCRKLIEDVRFWANYHFRDQAEPRFIIGTGGSHIWIHRVAEHVEGSPVESNRWAIITDADQGHKPAEQVYQVTGSVVKELNANVARATFSGRGEQRADLYTSPNECPVLVAHGTCAPANGEFQRTVKIVLP